MDDRIIHYFKGDMPEAERVNLLREIRSDESLRKEMAAYQNLQGMFMLSKENIHTEAGEKALMEFNRNRQKKRYLMNFRKGLAYAASVVVLVVSTWIAASYFNDYTTEFTASTQELYVPPGQRARITLPDGSIAWLNAGSTLTYPSVFEQERKISLSGEGYFEVEKMNGKPFIVSTSQVDIEVLGTEFNVASYSRSNSVTASLVKGSIKVYQPGKEEDAVIMQPNDEIEFKDGTFDLHAFTNQDMLLWKAGIYSFRNTSLEEIIRKLELYYDVEIIIQNDKILNYSYTGKFRQRDGILNILQIIQRIHQFNITVNDERNQITLS